MFRARACIRSLFSRRIITIYTIIIGVVLCLLLVYASYNIIRDFECSSMKKIADVMICKGLTLTFTIYMYICICVTIMTLAALICTHRFINMPSQLNILEM